MFDDESIYEGLEKIPVKLLLSVLENSFKLPKSLNNKILRKHHKIKCIAYMNSLEFNRNFIQNIPRHDFDSFLVAQIILKNKDLRKHQKPLIYLPNWLINKIKTEIHKISKMNERNTKLLNNDNKIIKSIINYEKVNWTILSSGNTDSSIVYNYINSLSLKKIPNKYI
jgi:hypothetical protein